jgi:hypothetical protein
MPEELVEDAMELARAGAMRQKVVLDGVTP